MPSCLPLQTPSNGFCFRNEQRQLPVDGMDERFGPAAAAVELRAESSGVRLRDEEKRSSELQAADGKLRRRINYKCLLRPRNVSSYNQFSPFSNMRVNVAVARAACFTLCRHQREPVTLHCSICLFAFVYVPA